MEILLIRHGHAQGDPYARPEPPAKGFLSEQGLRQAQKLGEALRSEKIDLAWCSPYGRAILTAETALEGRGVPISCLSFLHEWLPNRELAQTQSTEWEKINVAANDWEAAQCWKTDLGEGCLEMLARVGPPFLRELEKIGLSACHGGFVMEERAASLRLAVFAHGGSLSALLGFLLNIPPFPTSRFDFALTGVARLRLKRQGSVWYPQLVLPLPAAD